MFVALLGFLTLIGDGAAAAPRDERPLPWLGFGKDGGLIVDDRAANPDWPKGMESVDDYYELLATSTRRWLGPKAKVVAVDSRPEKSFYLEAAPTPGKDARVGKRFEVIGAEGACTIEVVTGMRAVLRFTDQFSDDDPVSVVYRGPGERVPPRRPIAEGATVITPAELTTSYQDDTPRLVGVHARVVEGTCPPDGVVAAPGQLVRVAVRDGEAALAAAVRKNFRANKYIVGLEKEFREDLATHGAKHFSCVDGAVPEHLDAFKSGMRTRVVEPPGQPALLVAQTGTESACDPARAAIVYRKHGEGWVHARDLWGSGTSALRFDVVVHDAASKHTWVAGPPLRNGSDGWEWSITALDVGGLGRTLGGWPDYAAHYCNYDETVWEFAAVCRLPDE